jgi:hypothetical protein
MSRKIEDNPLCICGHHQGIHLMDGKTRCLWEENELSPKYDWCRCNKFKQDNLKFLEMHYEKKTKI